MSDLSPAGVGRDGPTYRAFGFRFRLVGSLVPRLAPMFDGMRDTTERTVTSDQAVSAPDEGVSPDHLISLEQTASGTYLELAVDGTTTLRTSDLGALLHHAVWEVTQRGVASRRDCVVIHAGAVVVGQRIVIISGPSGSGKSTLVAALVDDGARFLTDEAVEIGPDGLVADALPRPIHLNNESLRLVDRSLVGQDVPMPGGGSYHSPTSDALRPWPTSTSVVLLDGHGDRQSTTKPRRSEAVSWLVGESFGSGAMSQVGLEIVKKLATRGPTVTISGGSVSARATLVRKLAVSP